MELHELAENAVVNYLAGLKNPDGSLVWPATMQRGAADNFYLRIFAGESGQEKDGQCILCIAKDSTEHIPSSGNYEVLMDVWLKTPVAKLTDSEKNATPPVADPLATHSAASEALRAAIMANGLELSLTSAIGGFTAWGILDRVPVREDVENYWASGFTLKIVCCASEFAN